MDPVIEHREAFTVLGLQSRVKQGSETSELFASIWQKFEAERAAIEPLAVSRKYYGINFPAESEGMSDYFTGMAVAVDSPVADGLLKRHVPAGDYAVIECAVERIGLCYQAIFTTWLPSAPVRFNPDHPVFEEYPEKDPTLPVRIHIPVTKNESSAKTPG